MCLTASLLHRRKFGRSGGADCPESLYCAARQDAPRGTPAPIKQFAHGFQFPLVTIAAAVSPPAFLETESEPAGSTPRRIPACNSCHVQRFLRPSCEPARTLCKSQNPYPIERGVMSAKALPFGPLRNLSATLNALARHNSRPFARLQQARKPASGKNGV